MEILICNVVNPNVCLFCSHAAMFRQGRWTERARGSKWRRRTRAPCTRRPPTLTHVRAKLTKARNATYRTRHAVSVPSSQDRARPLSRRRTRTTRVWRLRPRKNRTSCWPNARWNAAAAPTKQCRCHLHQTQNLTITARLHLEKGHGATARLHNRCAISKLL